MPIFRSNFLREKIRLCHKNNDTYAIFFVHSFDFYLIVANKIIAA